MAADKTWFQFPKRLSVRLNLMCRRNSQAEYFQLFRVVSLTSRCALLGDAHLGVTPRFDTADFLGSLSTFMPFSSDFSQFPSISSTIPSDYSQFSSISSTISSISSTISSDYSQLSLQPVVLSSIFERKSFKSFKRSKRFKL